MHNTYVEYSFSFANIHHSIENVFRLFSFLFLLAVCSPVCLNGGVCNAGNTCTCTASWSGTRCATRTYLFLFANIQHTIGNGFRLFLFLLLIAVCSPVCLNGGVCNAGNTCTCTASWTGTRCATRMSYERTHTYY